MEKGLGPSRGERTGPAGGLFGCCAGEGWRLQPRRAGDHQGAAHCSRGPSISPSSLPKAGGTGRSLRFPRTCFPDPLASFHGWRCVRHRFTRLPRSPGAPFPSPFQPARAHTFYLFVYNTMPSPRTPFICGGLTVSGTIRGQDLCGGEQAEKSPLGHGMDGPGWWWWSPRMPNPAASPLSELLLAHRHPPRDHSLGAPPWPADEEGTHPSGLLRCPLPGPQQGTMSGMETMSTATLALRLLPPDTLGGSLKGWGRLFSSGTVGHSVLPEEEEESPRGRLSSGDVWAGKSPKLSGGKAPGGARGGAGGQAAP